MLWNYKADDCSLEHLKIGNVFSSVWTLMGRKDKDSECILILDFVCFSFRFRAGTANDWTFENSYHCLYEAKIFCVTNIFIKLLKIQ